jgi:drug/metabolite transporter (DMT)-like permease
MALALAAACAYGVTVVVGRDLSRAGIAGASALAPRFATSAALLALFQLARGRSLLPPRGERLHAFLLGGGVYAVESSFFYGALGRGTAAAVTMLFYSYPAIVAVVEVALGRVRASTRLAMALALTIGGGAVVVTAGDAISLSSVGVVFALCSAACFSIYLLVGDHVAQRTDPPTKAMWVALGAACALELRAVITGASAPPASRYAELLAYGAANAFAFAFMFAALGRIGATRTAVILTSELVAAVALAALLLHERIQVAHLLGGCAVLAGAIAAALLPHERPAADTLAP